MPESAKPYTGEEIAVMRTHEPEFQDTTEERWLATIAERDAEIANMRVYIEGLRAALGLEADE